MRVFMITLTLASVTLAGTLLPSKLHAVSHALELELRACSRTLGYFTPVHERGTQWDNIEERIPTSLKQAPLIGFMSLAQRRAA